MFSYLVLSVSKEKNGKAKITEGNQREHETLKKAILDRQESILLHITKTKKQASCVERGGERKGESCCLKKQENTVYTNRIANTANTQGKRKKYNEMPRELVNKQIFFF